ncbi:hypothetical protein F4780DRAFT_472803 [Xylariomycetidae sp. FL0641]|nr:hypothetical protein F4780DRAFT_472803 [Xylariomycetidae sp. FL0641]
MCADLCKAGLRGKPTMTRVRLQNPVFGPLSCKTSSSAAFVGRPPFMQGTCSYDLPEPTGSGARLHWDERPGRRESGTAHFGCRQSKLARLAAGLLGLCWPAIRPSCTIQAILVRLPVDARHGGLLTFFRPGFAVLRPRYGLRRICYLPGSAELRPSGIISLTSREYTGSSKIDNNGLADQPCKLLPRWSPSSSHWRRLGF